MATFAAARMATADPHGDQRPVLSADVADATSVDVELASGARAVAARRPSRRRLYVGCGVASAFAAVIAVVAVYHAMEASKISGTTGDVIAVSVQDNCRSAVSTPAAIGHSSAAAFFQGAADVDITAQLHNPSALDVTLTACTATVKARRSADDDGLVVLVGTATDTVVPAGHASVGVHATLALSNGEDAVAMLTQLLDVGIGAAAEGTSATAAALDFSTLPFSLDATVTCTVKPVVLGLTPFGVTKTFLVPDLLKNARPAPSAAVVGDPAPTPTPAPTAAPTPAEAAPEEVAVSTQNPLSQIATMTGVSMTKDGESVVGVDVDAACVAGTLPEGVTFTPPATSLNLATGANARPLATLSFPRVCIGCTDEEVHTLLALSPGLMGILAAGPLVASAAERSGAHDPFGLNEPLGIYATGTDGTMCLSHEVIAAVNGPVALSRAARATMATASHEHEDVLHIADLAKL